MVYVVQELCGLRYLFKAVYIRAAQVCAQLLRAAFYLVAVALKGVADVVQYLNPCLRGKVGAAEEGLLVRCKKYIERPAAVYAERLDGIHIDLVDIGALFTIYLDTYEVLVHYGGDIFFLERLVLHNMAPMA